MITDAVKRALRYSDGLYYDIINQLIIFIINNLLLNMFVFGNFFCYEKFGFDSCYKQSNQH